MKRLPYRVICHKCDSDFVIHTNTEVNNIHFCPTCASKNIMSVPKTGRNFFEELSKRYSISEESVKELFKVWNVDVYPNFDSFVREILREVA